MFLLSFTKLLVLCSIIIGASPLEASQKVPKIITTSPTLTELIFQLGYGKTLVATSEFSDYPKEAKSLPTIGSLFYPSLEKIVRFSPDYVLVDSESTPHTLVTQLNKVKLASISIHLRSVEELFTSSKTLLQEIFRAQHLTILEEKTKQLQSNTKIFSKNFRFLIVAWISPLTLFGNSTFLSDLISKYGGQNLLNSNLQAAYPQVSLEWFVKNPPDILFLLTNQKENLDELQRLAQKWWPNQKVNLVALSPDYFARPTFTPLEHISAILKDAL
ncbi:MAG: hypothetical protein FJ116_08105 [Deltaproteobacteria bacterium]|nr:hypothetical protein [Deltaproteobacteria bacterium]